MIRVELPAHLRTLAHVNSEIKLEVEGPATQRSVLDALEARYPMLRGTIRDHVPNSAGPSCGSSLVRRTVAEPPDAPLPEAVASGKEPSNDDRRSGGWRLRPAGIS